MKEMRFFVVIRRFVWRAYEIEVCPGRAVVETQSKVSSSWFKRIRRSRWFSGIFSSGIGLTNFYFIRMCCTFVILENAGPISSVVKISLEFDSCLE